VDINATLIGQMITFLVLVLFTMKFVWPPLIKAMRDRQDKIADGLAAAERGRHDLELAQKKATDNLRVAKAQAMEIIDKANSRSTQMVDEAKDKARAEGAKLIEVAQADISKEVLAAKQQLRDQIALLAIAGAEKILGKEIDAASNKKLVDQVINDIERAQG
jgi:F-type H+-transporting ATPase subunit b